MVIFYYTIRAVTTAGGQTLYANECVYENNYILKTHFFNIHEVTKERK